MRSLCILVHSYATGTAHRRALQGDKLTLSGDPEMNGKTTGGSRRPPVPPKNSIASVWRASTGARFVHSGAQLCDRDHAQPCIFEAQTDTCGRVDVDAVSASVRRTGRPRAAQRCRQFHAVCSAQARFHRDELGGASDWMKATPHRACLDGSGLVHYAFGLEGVKKCEVCAFWCVLLRSPAVLGMHFWGAKRHWQAGMKWPGLRSQAQAVTSFVRFPEITS